MIMLDTSVLIEALRATDKTSTLLHTVATEGDVLAVSSVTVYEFRNGITKANQVLCEQMLNTLSVCAFDDDAARIASTIYRSLKSQSSLIEIADILIAATALANNLPLATLNIRHFQRIHGLTLITA